MKNFILFTIKVIITTNILLSKIVVNKLNFNNEQRHLVATTPIHTLSVTTNSEIISNIYSEQSNDYSKYNSKILYLNDLNSFAIGYHSLDYKFNIKIIDSTPGSYAEIIKYTSPNASSNLSDYFSNTFNYHGNGVFSYFIRSLSGGDNITYLEIAKYDGLLFSYISRVDISTDYSYCSDYNCNVNVYDSEYRSDNESVFAFTIVLYNDGSVDRTILSICSIDVSNTILMSLNYCWVLGDLTFFPYTENRAYIVMQNPVSLNLTYVLLHLGSGSLRLYTDNLNNQTKTSINNSLTSFQKVLAVNRYSTQTNSNIIYAFVTGNNYSGNTCDKELFITNSSLNLITSTFIENSDCSSNQLFIIKFIYPWIILTVSSSKFNVYHLHTSSTNTYTLTFKCRITYANTLYYLNDIKTYIPNSDLGSNEIFFTIYKNIDPYSLNLVKFVKSNNNECLFYKEIDNSTQTTYCLNNCVNYDILNFQCYDTFCPIDKYMDNNSCLYCPLGERALFNTCITSLCPSNLYEVTLIGGYMYCDYTCPLNLLNNNNICVDMCPIEKYNNQGNCEYCNIGEKAQNGICIFTNCDVDKVEITITDGYKYCDTSCPLNQVNNNSICTDTCPIDKYNNQGICEYCPTNFKAQDGICIDTNCDIKRPLITLITGEQYCDAQCLENEVFEDNSCKDTCTNLGNINNNGVCEKCPNNSYLDTSSNQCVSDCNPLKKNNDINFVCEECLNNLYLLDSLNSCIEEDLCLPLNPVKNPTNHCFDCSSINKYYENYDCVDLCATDNYGKNQETMSCEYCESIDTGGFCSTVIVSEEVSNIVEEENAPIEEQVTVDDTLVLSDTNADNPLTEDNNISMSESSTCYGYKQLDKCVSECSENFILNSSNECICSNEIYQNNNVNDNLIINQNNKCIFKSDFCKANNMLLKETYCIEQCGSNYYLIESVNTCHKECSSNTMKSSYINLSTNFYVINDGYNNICKECSYYIDNQLCVQKCGIFKGPDINKICKECKYTLNKYVLDGNCLSYCPENYVSINANGIENLCSFNYEEFDSNITCKNDGILILSTDSSISVCKCNKTYFGEDCSLSKTEFDKLRSLLNEDIDLLISNNQDSLNYDLPLNYNLLNSVFSRIEHVYNVLDTEKILDLSGKVGSIDFKNNVNNELNTMLNTIDNMIGVLIKNNLYDTNNQNITNQIKDLLLLGLSSNKTNISAGGIVYKGKYLTIQKSSNTPNDLSTARKLGLNILNYSNCENKLKENNNISKNEKLSSLNINIINPNIYTDIYNKISTNSTNDNEKDSSNLMNGKYSLNTYLINKNNKIVNTSSCNEFEYLYNMKDFLPNQQEYIRIYNDTGKDIYNSSSTLFYDICEVLTGENNTDIVVNDRRERYNKTIKCSEGCIYNGIDEHFYSKCKCTALSANKTFNYLEDSVFTIFYNSNIFLVACYKNIFKFNIVKNYGFLYFTSISAIWIVTLLIYKCYSYTIIKINYKKLIYNDAIDLNDKSIINHDRLSINSRSDNNPLNVGQGDFKEFDNNNNTNNKKITNDIDILKIDNDHNKDMSKNNNNSISGLSSPDKLLNTRKRFVFNKQRNNIIYPNKNTNTNNLKHTEIDYNELNSKNNKSNVDYRIKNKNPSIKDNNSLLINNFTSERKMIAVNDKLPVKKLLLNNNKNTNTLKLELAKARRITIGEDKKSFIDGIIVNINDKTTQSKENLKAIIRNQIPNKVLVQTSYDMTKAPIEVQLNIDKSNFFIFFLKEIKNNHEFISLFFFTSIINPFFVRFSVFIFALSIKLGLNALFFSDNYIKEQTSYRLKYGENSTDYWFVISKQMFRVLWPMFISIILKNLINVIIIVPKKHVKELNSYLATQNSDKIVEGSKLFNKRMRVRYIAFLTTVFILHVLNWYFVLCFCSTYIFSNYNWVIGTFIAIITDYFLIKIAIHMIKCILREMLKYCKWKIIRFMYTFWCKLMTILKPRRISY